MEILVWILLSPALLLALLFALMLAFPLLVLVFAILIMPFAMVAEFLKSLVRQ